MESDVANYKGRANEKFPGYAAKLYRKKFAIIGNIYNSHEIAGVAQANALKLGPEEEIAPQSVRNTPQDGEITLEQ